MKLRAQIVKQVNRMTPGEIFDFSGLVYPANKSSNVAVILHDLKNDGIIIPIAKGVFYKPRISILDGMPLPVRDDKVLEYVLKRYDGHVAGPYMYSKINLTQQVGFVVTIATPKPMRAFEFAGRNFVFEKSPVGYINKDKYIVGCLDALKNISDIPGCTEVKAYRRLRDMISNMTSGERESLFDYGLKYPPRVRMALCNIFKSVEDNLLSERLASTLNSSVILSSKSKKYMYETA